MSNSGFNRLRISARYLVSNSAESHGYMQSLLIGLFLPCVWSNSGFDQSEATVYILATQRDLKQDMGLINKVDMVCLSPVGYGV